MQTISLTLPSLTANLALDEALLLEAEEGRSGEVLRFWDWCSYGVVLGAAGILSDDVDEASCVRDGVGIARRGSGGGTVLLGPGCLCFSLILECARNLALTQITPSYQYILGKVGVALGDLVEGIELAGSSDLTSAGRKFSGNAQQRKQRCILHHGTLLYGFDLARLPQYLRSPPRQPDYRAGRSHCDFVMNLPATRAQLVDRLQTIWGATGELVNWPEERTQGLVESKYGRAEWVRRR